MTEQNKAVVSVSEMARMVGLSRQRLYQLMGTTFPSPKYDPETGRPFFDQELQQVCLRVRRTNCGIDGQPVLFYAKRHRQTVPKRHTKRSQPKFAGLIDGLAGLGLPSVTLQQVAAILKTVFPDGTETKDEGEVLKAVFLHLKRQNLGDNVER